MSTKDTKASLEAELDSARLQSLYDTSIPSIIKRWKKIIPSSALEYLIEAESQLHSLPSIHSAPEITTEIDTTLKKASSCLSKAYATLLSDHQIPPIPENDSRSLPSPPSSPDQLAAFKTKIGNSQIYVEIVVSKALILYFQSEYQECLRVLNEEVDLPPVGPPSLRGMGIVYLIKGVILKILALEKLSNSPAALDSTSSGCYEYLLKLFPATSASAEDQQQLSQTPSLVTEDVLRSRGTLDNLREGMFRGSLCWTKLWFDQVSKKVLKYKQALKSGTNHVNGNLEPETASIDFSHLTIQTLQFYRLYFKYVDTNLPSDDSQRNKRRIVVNQWFIRFLVIWARLLSENELTDIPSYPPLDDVSLDTDSNAENVHRSPSSSKQPLAVQNNDTNSVPPDYKGQKVVRLFYRELDKAFGTWFDTVISIVPNPKAPAAHDPKSESKSYIIGKDSVEPFTSNKFMEELCDTLMWAELVLNDSSMKHKRKSIEMIYRAFKHTFHSLRIMRHLVVAHTLNYDYVSALAVLHEYVDLAEERLKSAPHLQSAIFPDVLCPTFGSVLRFALDSVKLKKVKFSGFVEYEDGIKELLDVLVMGSQILATELYQIPKAREMCDQALQLLSSHVLSPISQTSNTNGTHPPTENRQVQKKFQQDWQFIICKTYQTVAIVYYMSSNEGSDLERRNRYQLKCIQYLNEALQLNTKNWEIYYQLALAHAERKERRTA
ncbi:hypothetical protein BKA69DRAFT_578938 [Paraphysoderma sedebokerense]|nr:hypothetical protein BKA69DRAFT_578938 [Paraphysoderma sedebokerense]